MHTYALCPTLLAYCLLPTPSRPPRASSRPVNKGPYEQCEGSVMESTKANIIVKSPRHEIFVSFSCPELEGLMPNQDAL
jgi:hypothetical protein